MRLADARAAEERAAADALRGEAVEAAASGDDLRIMVCLTDICLLRFVQLSPLHSDFGTGRLWHYNMFHRGPTSAEQVSGSAHWLLMLRSAAYWSSMLLSNV